MNDIKEYVKLYRKFKTDTEIALETGVSADRIAEIRRQINKDLRFERMLRSKKRTGRF